MSAPITTCPTCGTQRLNGLVVESGTGERVTREAQEASGGVTADEIASGALAWLESVVSQLRDRASTAGAFKTPAGMKHAAALRAELDLGYACLAALRAGAPAAPVVDGLRQPATDAAVPPTLPVEIKDVDDYVLWVGDGWRGYLRLDVKHRHCSMVDLDECGARRLRDAIDTWLVDEPIAAPDAGGAQ